MNKHTDPFWRTNTKNTDKLYKLSESTEAKKKSTSESVLSADWLQLTQKPPSLFVALELKKLRHRTSLKTSGSMFLSGFEADDILHRVRCIYIYICDRWPPTAFAENRGRRSYTVDGLVLRPGSFYATIYTHFAPESRRPSLRGN